MIVFNIRDYIMNELPERMRAYFSAIGEPLLEDAVLRTAKLALADAEKNKGKVSHSTEYEAQATNIRSHTTRALGIQHPGSQAMVTSLAIVAYTEKFVQECLEQPTTEVSQIFLEQARQHEPTPYID